MDAKLDYCCIADQRTFPEDRNSAINDEAFCGYIDRLKNLHYFFYQEAVPAPSDTDAIGMGDLSLLHFDPKGRAPTVQEWVKVEKRTQTLFLILPAALRKKFLMSETPWVVSWLPVGFLSLAALSLFLAIASLTFLPDFVVFLFYLIWLAALGAIGALAYIGMNALLIQEDITFDLTNMRLFSLRVAIGSLFGVVLTVPFGYTDFHRFCLYILTPDNPAVTSIGGALTKQAILLLLPFILGFSTSLVILILSQLMEAVQVFLGRKPSQIGATSGATSTLNRNPGGKRTPPA